MLPRVLGVVLLTCGTVAAGGSVLAGPPQENARPDPLEAGTSVGATAAGPGYSQAASTVPQNSGGAPYAPVEPQAVFEQQPMSVPPEPVWASVPPVRVFPRPGNFFIPPKGPGAYSLRDALSGTTRPARRKSGYPAFCIMAPPFYDADFRYLDSVPDEERLPYERLKRIHLGEDFLFSTGGAAWYRYTIEINSRLTERNNDYTLGRIRTYGDLWYRDQVRVYAEFIAANRWGGELPALPIDVDRADMLNLFAEVKLFDFQNRPVYVRGGRQEVLLGSQRLLSPLPWANVRRNFDGVRVFRQGEKFDVDAFWLEPVRPNPSRFDSTNSDRQLAGTWLTWRPQKGHFFDLFYLYSSNSAAVTQQGISIAPSRFSTLGTRYAGDRDNWLWDVEAALQLGQRGSADLVAGMATAGAGYHFADALWNPTLWVYYDYASGDSSPNAGRFNTFNQLYPFGHYYLGWADIAGRQNIQDFNLHLGFYPVKWVTAWLQYHHFWLANARDALYNAGGVAIRRDPTGAAGNNVGDEFDFVLNFHLTVQSDFFVAYAQVFEGSYLQKTSGPNKAAATEALYLIYNFRW